MAFVRNGMHTGSRDPAVVEVEQRADRDRLENCLVIPAGSSQLLDIGESDGWQVPGYFGGKSQQDFLFLLQTLNSPDRNPGLTGAGSRITPSVKRARCIAVSGRKAKRCQICHYSPPLFYIF